MTDEERARDGMIVALFWQRDERAIRETDACYGRMLFLTACRMLGDRGDSDEAVNDTYLAAWRSIPPQRPVFLGGYLLRLVRQTAVDRLRRKAAQKRAGESYALCLEELAECVPDENEPYRLAETHQLTAEIERFLRTLTPPLRQAFVSRYFFLEPVRTVAERLGMTEGQLKTALYRVRRALREELEQKELIG